MTRALTRAIVIVGALAGLAGLGWAVVGPGRESNAPRPRGERPALMLLTGLPLVFGEDFSLSGGGSPALKALQSHYRVLPISTTSSDELKRSRLLLMAQPPAQTAENLVALDAWIRGGGRVLLLADPLLEWPSRRPLGDPLRPLPMFADTGLLAHWGLKLAPPDRAGMVIRYLGGRRVAADSPGRLEGACRVSRDAFIARCRVGSGHVTVVADADFLNVEARPQKARENMPALIDELAELDSARFG